MRPRASRRGWASAALAAGALAFSGCGSGGSDERPAPPTRTFATHGVTMRLPAGWQPARRSMTPHLVDPREVFVVSTYPLRYRDGGCAQLPTSALQDLGARDALVTVQERRGTDAGFAPRPAHLAALDTGPSEASACAPGTRFTDHWLAFADAGRNFHVEVAFGPRASAATRRQAWAILDGLRVSRRGAGCARPTADPACPASRP